MKMKLEAIREYWQTQAVEHGVLPDASWTDVYAINLEIAEITKWLASGIRVIDIGCGNGFSTVQYAAQHEIEIKGVDYVPEMIAAANARLEDPSLHLKGSIS